MTLAIGAVLLIAGLGMIFAKFYVVISIALMTFGIAMILSGVV
jgi:hypothetical protein